MGLPDPDTLQPGDDFRAFMAKAVPDRLRRRALRRLWQSNPALANLDGLVDYGEDFTDSATVIENMQTAYQVGKGMTAHVEEMARQAEAEAQAAADAEDPDPARGPEDETNPAGGRGRGTAGDGGAVRLGRRHVRGRGGRTAAPPHAVRIRRQRRSIGMTQQEAFMQDQTATPEITEEDALRADLYDFLAALLARPPGQDLLTRPPR